MHLVPHDPGASSNAAHISEELGIDSSVPRCRISRLDLDALDTLSRVEIKVPAFVGSMDHTS